MRTLALTLALPVVLASVPASSAELKPMRPSTVDLGTFRGTAYYTVEKAGYRVVATLAATNTGTDRPQVIRLVTILNPDQTVHLSVPGTLGADGRESTIAFSRRGDAVNVASAE